MKIKAKRLFRIFPICYLPLAICYMLTGCATVPEPLRESIKTYSVNGKTYFSLAEFSRLRGIDYKYDTFTKTVVLSGRSHKVSLRVSDSLALVDGKPLRLQEPIDFYQGIAVAPVKFKEQVLDSLFVKSYAPARKRFSISTKVKKVVIDAGHGGHDPGTIGRTGTREKVINLDVAKRLAKLLKSEGVQVVMTRSSDNFIPLPTRVKIANRSGADLFISIHSNANRVRSLRGFEAYYVANNVDDAKRGYQAAKGLFLNLENASFDNHSLDLKAIVWDMIYTNNRAESVELSRAICRSADSNLDVKILGVKGARFQVLKGVSMPGVLVEIGFLSNPSEEKMLKNSYYRQKIAESLLEGVQNYSKNSSLLEFARK